MCGGIVACAGGPRPAPVTPAEIPTLKARIAQQPHNVRLRFRLAAAYMGAGQCDSAVAVARAGELLVPGDALGPIVIGGCRGVGGRFTHPPPPSMGFWGRPTLGGGGGGGVGVGPTPGA